MKFYGFKFLKFKDTAARLSLDETKEFSEAIQAAVDKVDLEETLIVVTADHSHVSVFLIQD